jgi:hypothetical protein
MSLTQPLHPLTALRQGSTPSGKALHKPVLLLALLEEMEIRGALIAIDAALKKRFESIWMLLMPDQKPGDFFKPVYHLPNDGFWEVLDRHGRRVAREYGSLSLITKSVPPVCTKSVPLGNSKLVNIVELCQEIFDSVTFT